MAEKKDRISREDQATVAQIVQASPIPTFVIDAFHRVIHWNRALENLCGRRAEDMLNTRRHWVIYQAGPRPTLADAIVDRKPIGDVKPYYGGCIRPSERVEGAFEAEEFFPNMGDNGMWLFITAAPVLGRDGNMLGAVETLWDKTGEKRAFDEKERRADQLSGLCAVSDALCRPLNVEACLVSAAPEIARLLAVDAIAVFSIGTDGGFTPIYAAGLHSDDCLPGLSEPLRGLLEEALARNTLAVLEFNPAAAPLQREFWTRNGLKVVYLMPLSAEGIVGMLLLGSRRFHQFSPEVKNIVELVGGRIAAAVEIARLHRQLVDAERMAAIGQTAAGLAHYIKNILLGLKGGSYVMDVGLSKKDFEKTISGWGAIQNSIGRISELVNDLLSYAKERAPDYRPCRPNDIVREILTLFRENAERDGIRIIENLDPSIGEVSMDGRTVHRSVLNLTANAVDACTLDEDRSKQRQITVKTVLERPDLVRFEVHDTGIGMDEDVMKKLFTWLFSTKGGKGTGIGLLVTRKLVQEHNGTITVDSKLGVGSVFTVRLPCKASGRV